MAFGELGTDALKAENVDKLIKGFALREFVLKQVCSVQTSGAWKESYYTESKTELSATAKIARLAAFPTQSPLWQKNTAYLQKHGLELDISWEDVMTDDIPVLARSQLRIARAVAKSVDDLIYTTLAGAAGVLTSATPGGFEWDSDTRASRHPQDQIGDAIRLLATNNYTATHLIVNPKDYYLLVTNDDIIDAFTPTSSDIIKNGKVGRILNLEALVTNAVPADEALVLEAKTCATYRVAEELRTMTKREEGIKYTIRAWELGVPFVTDPEAICKITNTNK